MSSSVTSKEEAPPAGTERGIFTSLSGVVARGVAAGLVGGTALALFFLIVDGAEGVPLRTPSFIANALVGSTGVEMGFGLVVLYTIIHFAAFVALGVLVSWLLTLVETASPVLLGLVLGFLMFDLLFYGSVVVTGVNVVEELGWPEVLAGNLVAGVTMLGMLHLLGATQPVTWMESFSANRVVREGVVAGLIGAMIVAGWFLIFDLMRGQPFFTPAALGSTLFLGASSISEVSITPIPVLGYSLLHFSAFILAGFLAAGIAAAAEDQPPLVLGAVLFFAVFEAFFMGALAMLAEFLLGTLAWWTVAVGNLLAAVSMGLYLWMHHPKLRAALIEDPLDKTD
jgi:hypothetical protein